MKISVLIPCYNEEASILACIDSCLAQTRPVDEIVVVDDGSTDSSSDILKSYGGFVKVVSTDVASGNKSYAQELGLQHVTGDIVVMTDADTVLDDKFVEYIEKDFSDSRVVAVCGYVKSMKYNWLTACREIDYALTQNIHKIAQSEINFLTVIPGCAAAFRTKLFTENSLFDHDTVTEDLDITYKLHEMGLGIMYNRNAIVYTQDPGDLRSYWRQMKRWYAGGWQNLIKHRRLLQKPVVALELSLLYIEGSMLPVMLVVLPIVNVAYFVQYLLSYLMMSYVVAGFAAIISRRADLLLYAPLYLPVILLNAAAFTREFFAEVILRQRSLVWQRADRREVTL